uniref:Uncharacterized protein n=1 Tax=Candidatus Kentrum sp. FM TaxID=2126340 RepID=A0A450SJX0_9GAMM|nr:MAG: hypothetical protein BECKFM1743A_GA0114220_101196 [Candidatus Kentron sp. FM]VFJ54301.1 MAG: hypothetical protein BECKFM1743C_GA0114222_101376 [Candidatus Kentron sp. FM]VFK10215.1 MAG: hypothetical protein BECKFM1743B_GA0114221_101337 [Candidatus Kentron sp. FM]
MKRSYSKAALFLIMPFVFTMASAELVNTVSIESPTDGQEVGARVVVKGTSNIVDDESNVWVLVHPKLFAGQWWPQNKPVRDIKTGNWEALAYIGQKADIGLEFEIAVATFKGEAEKKILEYHDTGRRTGSFLPIPFPETTSPIKIITVKKVSHLTKSD